MRRASVRTRPRPTRSSSGPISRGRRSCACSSRSAASPLASAVHLAARGSCGSRRSAPRPNADRARRGRPSPARYPRRVSPQRKAKAEEEQADGERTKLVADNRRAFFNYAIDEKVEAGIALTGSEIKSIRGGRVDLRDGYAKIDRGSAWLRNVRIARCFFFNATATTEIYTLSLLDALPI